MAKYDLPTLTKPSKTAAKQVCWSASGDLRLSANQTCWPKPRRRWKRLLGQGRGRGRLRAGPRPPVQGRREARLHRLAKRGHVRVRRHRSRCQADRGRSRLAVFAPCPVRTARHKGPILTVANWSGTWPGLVGMLNLNASLTKAGKKYSTLWSEDFTDEFFVDDLQHWLRKGEVRHATKHVTPLKKVKIPAAEATLGKALAQQFARQKAIMGIFDEGCMGMYNAIIPDELLNPLGVYKERLSQSALYYETTQVSDDEAREVRRWMEERGMKFVTGPDEQKRPDRPRRFSASARCISPPCGSPTISAAP